MELIISMETPVQETVRGIAVKMYNLGLHPLALAPGQKCPTYKNWNAWNLDRVAIEQNFKEDSGLGLLCGRDFFVVDVDTEKAKRDN